MTGKFISVDTEFNNTQERFVNPVCAVIRDHETNEIRKYWYDQMEDFKKDFINYIENGYYILTFMSAAEYRFFLSIGMTREYLKKAKVYDIYPMWRMILYGIDSYNWGDYVTVEDGKKVMLKTHAPKKGERRDGEYYQDSDGNYYRHEDLHTRKYNPSLVHACIKLLDVDMVTEHKDKMRDIILFGNIEENKDDIMDYCADDTQYLYPLFEKCFSIIYTYSESYRRKDVLEYGKWMLDVATIECNGIPIDVEKVKNFASNFYNLSVDIPTRCNEVYKFFEWDKKKSKFVQKYHLFEEFVSNSGIKWPKTEKGQYKYDKKTLEPLRDSFREIRVLQATIDARKDIGYFKPKNIQKMLSNIGSDNRWRGSLMPYGSVTSRNQPKPSDGYVFGMSRWVRNLVNGCVIGGDYSAQEIYIQGFLSGDEHMLTAYKTGDPYTWFACKANIIPPDIKRIKGLFHDSNGVVNTDLQMRYSQTRALSKSMLLGMGYGMGVDSLGLRLTAANIDALTDDDREKLFNGDKEIQKRVRVYGREAPHHATKEQRAQFYLEMYQKVFNKYHRWKQTTYERYLRNSQILLTDGWRRIGSNGNKTSIVNFPVQGEAAVILRKAVHLCLDRGLRISTTLHDALYVETTEQTKDADMQILHECMVEAGGGDIRVDVHEQIIDWVNLKSNWSDEKGYEEFKRFGKYFLDENIS